MPVKIGTDLIEIERIRRALDRPGFRDRCFTAAEQEYCETRRNPPESYAARFCGKEAVGKALGCGVRFTWKEIEIVGPPKPGVTLSGKTLRFAERVGLRELDVSLTHSHTMAGAVCVAELEPPRSVTLEPLITADEMRAAEERYPGYPATVDELMERAGTAVALEAMSAYPGSRRFGVVCGKGANGGDGRVAARVLCEHGREAEETSEPEGYDVVVDALLGTGARGAPRPAVSRLIRRINASGSPVVSVDLPSGVDASTGQVAGEVVDASLTVTFQARKVGHVVAPGRFHAGHVVVADIGLGTIVTAARRATVDLLRLVPLRSSHDTKFTAGSVLVIGGAPGTTGAAVLASLAALRADAGYVTLAVPDAALPTVEALALEPVKRGFAWSDPLEVIVAAAERADAVAIGPGLGRSPEAHALVRDVLATLPQPMVVDADGLHRLEPVGRSAPTVLTPHAGELARLLDRPVADVQAARLEAAREAASRFGCVVVLKGPDTIVQPPDGPPVVADAGPPSLATAGTGDVLTGIVAAFLAKGLAPVDAAAAGAIAHGLAAARVRHQAGLVASDVVSELPAVLSQ